MGFMYNSMLCTGIVYLYNTEISDALTSKASNNVAITTYLN